MLTGQLAGAAGTLASLGDDGPAVRAAFCRLLDLAEPAVPWHAARDRLRELVFALAEIGAAAERIAAEIVRLQATEVAEVWEPSTDSSVGSSTMPQKRNPMVCEYVIASARLLRGPLAVLEASAAHASERDMGAWALEWVAVPEAMILAAGILDKLAAVLEGLGVDPGADAEEPGAHRRGDHGRGRDDGPGPPHRARARPRGRLGGEPPRGDVGRADCAPPCSTIPSSRRHSTPRELDALLDPSRYLGLAAETAAAVGAATDLRTSEVQMTVNPSYPTRLERLTAWLEESGLDCAVLFGADHVTHFTGYARYFGGASAVVVGRDGSRTLVVALDEAPIATGALGRGRGAPVR